MLSQLLQRQEATVILMYRESVKDVPISTYGMEEWICSLLASQKKELIEEIRKECERKKRKTDLSLMELSQAQDCGYNLALSDISNYLIPGQQPASLSKPFKYCPHCGERLR